LIIKKVLTLFALIVILFSCGNGDIDLGIDVEYDSDFRDEFIGYWSFYGEGYDVGDNDFSEYYDPFSINNYQGRITKYDDDIYFSGGYFIKIEYHTNKSVIFRVTENGDLLSNDNQTILGSINSSEMNALWMTSSHGLNGSSERHVELTGIRN